MEKSMSEMTVSSHKSREFKLFPSSLDNEKSSMLFLKRMLFLVVSHVMNKRQLLPPSSFKEISVDGLKRCMVAEDTKLGRKLSLLLYRISEVVEKHYLRDLLILVTTEEIADKSDEVSEVYTLTFYYGGGGGMVIRSPSHEFALSCNNTELRKQVHELFHRLDSILDMLSPLPPDLFPFFKLVYYGGTPVDYEPPGFKSSSTKYCFNGDTFFSKTWVGAFNTEFLRCAVYVESSFFACTTKERDQIGFVAANKSHSEQHLQSILGPKQLDYYERTNGRKRKITADEHERSGRKVALGPVLFSTPNSQQETSPISQEKVTEAVESVRTSLFEDTFQREHHKTDEMFLHRMEEDTNTTELQTSNNEYPGALPTITELVSGGPALKKSTLTRSLPPGISITAELDASRELFLRRSPLKHVSASADLKDKKMKMSRSKNIYFSAQD